MPEQHHTAEVEYRQIDRIGPGYTFGTDGSVWSRSNGGVIHEEWTKLNPHPDKRGRLRVDIRIPGSKPARYKHHFVHDLILEAFIGPRPPGMICRHFPDRDPSNNRIENLQWGTPQQNTADRIVHGTDCRGEKSPCTVLTETDIVRIRILNSQGVKQDVIGREYNLKQAAVSHICTGRNWKTAGGPIIRR